MSKSPMNFLGGNIARELMSGMRKKRTRKALKKIDKRLGSIEEKLDASSEESAVPEIDASMDAVEETPIAEPPADAGAVEPVPGAVDALEEDSFATAGDSGLNMVRNIMRRKNKK